MSLRATFITSRMERLFRFIALPATGERREIAQSSAFPQMVIRSISSSEISSCWEAVGLIHDIPISLWNVDPWRSCFPSDLPCRLSIGLRAPEQSSSTKPNQPHCKGAAADRRRFAAFPRELSQERATRIRISSGKTAVSNNL